MNANVTRQVISDLWPLYVSGEGSHDTRGLVETFLAADPDFARELRENAGGEGLRLTATVPTLAPDHALRTLARTRQRLQGHVWLLLFAMVFTMGAFGRIVSDTSWDVSPRNFIIMAAIAVVCWVAFFVTLVRMRAQILVIPGGRG
jgi:anti-sigma factor RsiW